jgi:hypothetical protein
VLESTRAREMAVKQETTEHIAAFRKLQEEAERKASLSETGELTISPTMATAEGAENWAAVGRKRKKGKEKEGFRGLKIRKTSSSASKLGGDPEGQELKSLRVDDDKMTLTSLKSLEKEAKVKPIPSTALRTVPAKQPSSGGLGLLAGYSSDDEE